jgi:hypothetical protein
MINRLIEALRFIFVFVGFWVSLSKNNPQVIFTTFAPIIILSMSGLTALQLLFLNKDPVVGYVAVPRYQIQSGLNLLALFLATLIAWWLNWGTMAYAALMSVTLLFFGLSGINHAASAIYDRNYTKLNLMRPFLSLVFIVGVLYIMLPALGVAVPYKLH